LLRNQTELTEDILEFLNMQIRWITEFPEHARIRVEHGTNSLIVEIKADPRDTGKLIGRNGLIISSIRTLVNAYCRKTGHNVYLQVLEAKRSRTTHDRRYDNNAA